MLSTLCLRQCEERLDAKGLQLDARGCKLTIGDDMTTTTTNTAETRSKAVFDDKTKDLARVMYQHQGLDRRAIAAKLGVKLTTVGSWITRLGWAKDRVVVADAIKHATRETAGDIGARRAREIDGFLDRSTRDATLLRDKAIAALVEAEPEDVDRLKGISSVLSSVCSMTRQALGLDNQATSTPGTLVNISLSGASLSAPIGAGNAARPIDVATVDTSESIPTS